MKTRTVYYDGLTNKAYWFVVANFILVALVLNFFPSQLKFLGEDSLAENLGALFLFLTGLILGAGFWDLFRAWKKGRLEKKDYRWLLFGLAAIAFLWAAGEEISWGQRIFDISTPEYLREVNRQNELNLHNLNTRFFNNALETLILLLIFIPTILYHFGVQRVLKIKVPDFQLILCFQLIATYKTYNYLKDQDYIAYLILFYWFWIMLRRKDWKGGAMIVLNALLVTVIGFSNFYLQDRFPTNATREFREYLFSFLCVIYSLYIYLDVKCREKKALTV